MVRWRSCEVTLRGCRVAAPKHDVRVTRLRGCHGWSGYRLTRRSYPHIVRRSALTASLSGVGYATRFDQ
jgi:hypothetical protein